MPAGTALLAVGGYGRGELFPHSDVDVLVLLPPTVTGDVLKASIEAFITACWDIGLEIGSSVRSVAECIAMARSDVTVQTALLESRYLCGSRRVFNELPPRQHPGDGAESLPAREDARDGAAPPQVRGHAVRARAELQGKPRRPARSAGRDLGGARRGPRQDLGGAGREGA